MTRFKVDDGAWGHPKFELVSDKAVALWVMAGSWCGRYLTNGQVPAGKLALLRGDQRSAEELVSAGLWNRTKTGYVFRDWRHYQETKSEVEAKREEDRSRQRKHREKSKCHGVTNAVTNNVTHDECHSVTPGEERRGEETVRSERIDLSTRTHAREPWAELVRLGLASPDDAEREAIATEHELADWGDA